MSQVWSNQDAGISDTDRLQQWDWVHELGHILFDESEKVQPQEGVPNKHQELIPENGCSESGLHRRLADYCG